MKIVQAGYCEDKWIKEGDMIKVILQKEKYIIGIFAGLYKGYFSNRLKIRIDHTDDKRFEERYHMIRDREIIEVQILKNAQ